MYPRRWSDVINPQNNKLIVKHHHNIFILLNNNMIQSPGHFNPYKYNYGDGTMLLIYKITKPPCSLCFVIH